MAATPTVVPLSTLENVSGSEIYTRMCVDGAQNVITKSTVNQ